MNNTIIIFKDLTKKFQRDKFVLDKNDSKELLSSICFGDLVWHNRFGQGRVHEISSDIISIDFDYSIKKFQFPDSILEGYIKILKEECL